MSAIYVPLFQDAAVGASESLVWMRARSVRGASGAGSRNLSQWQPKFPFYIYLECGGKNATTLESEVEQMAFIRKRGQSYYLVHNVREEGQVRQIHLACLGRRPRINDAVVEGVKTKHPFVRINWKGLRARASRDLVQPFENNSQYLRDLLSAIRELHLDLADLPLPVLEMAKDRELSSQLVSGLRLLRGTLDVKLNQLRKVKALPFRA